MSRRHLLGLGFHPRSIEHRVWSGRLHPVGRGVYAVGWSPMTRRREWLAAILGCGGEVVLSHRSAAALWGVAPERPGWIDLSSPTRRETKRAGIRIRHRGLAPGRRTIYDGIPVTTPLQTLIDIALELPAGKLERAVNDADKLELIDPETLRQRLDDHAGEPGVKPLRTLLDKDTFVLSDTALEVLFRPIAVAAGLPAELTKHVINEFEVDFYWPSLGLVVETDGLRYHRTAASQRRDAVRDNEHVAAGYTRLRFTHWQVKHEPAYVRAILARTRPHLRPRPDPDRA